MKSLPYLASLPLEVQKEITSAYNEIENCISKGATESINTRKEKFAELLNQSGLHEESRKYFREIAQSAISLSDKSRLLRKLSSSHLAQREYLPAHQMAEEALAVLRELDEAEVNITEFFAALTECAVGNYFIKNEKGLKALIKEMRFHFPSITDQSVKLRFYFVIMLDIAMRHRWYMLPEESVTHGEFYVQHALETGNWNTIGGAYSELGFTHLWREEHEDARRNFKIALEYLQNRNFDFVLPAQVYNSVSYRMQNNTSMTEAWALLSMESAKKTNNQSYQALTYGNLAWVYCKRNNLLYAEDYARKGIAPLIDSRHPFVYLCIFPLLECLAKQGQYEEAGKYCYFLMHPALKEFPTGMKEKIEAMYMAWLTKDVTNMGICLDELLFEIKLSNYF